MGIMVKIRTVSTRKPPQGWDEIEPTLQELNQRMKDAENEPHEGKRKPESLWPILRIHHQRSRYIYELYKIKKQISQTLYEWCLRQNYADGALIAKWKKPGYEKLCCLMCIQQKITILGPHVYAEFPKRNSKRAKL